MHHLGERRFDLSGLSSQPVQMNPDTYLSFRDAADEVVTLAAGADLKQGEEEKPDSDSRGNLALNHDQAQP